jgi:hypothetical protein
LCRVNKNTDHHPIGLLLSQFNQGQMPLMKTTHGSLRVIFGVAQPELSQENLDNIKIPNILFNNDCQLLNKILGILILSKFKIPLF